jgi:hypothetical protein
VVIVGRLGDDTADIPLNKSGEVRQKWLAFRVGATLLQIGVSLNGIMSSLPALIGSPTVWSCRTVIEKAVRWSARHVQIVDEVIVEISERFDCTTKATLDCSNNTVTLNQGFSCGIRVGNGSRERGWSTRDRART